MTKDEKTIHDQMEKAASRARLEISKAGEEPCVPIMAGPRIKQEKRRKTENKSPKAVNGLEATNNNHSLNKIANEAEAIRVMERSIPKARRQALSFEMQLKKMLQKAESEDTAARARKAQTLKLAK